MESFTGKIIDRSYRVCAFHGRLADAEVYVGEPLQQGPRVAIAFLRQRITDDETLEAFEREGRALSRFTHPDIAEVFDFGVHQQRPYVITSVPNGAKLSAEVDRLRARPDAAIHAISALHDALAAARAENLVHGELTIGSLVVTPQGRMMIVDHAVVRLTKAIEVARGECVVEDAGEDAELLSELARSLFAVDDAMPTRIPPPPRTTPAPAPAPARTKTRAIPAPPPQLAQLPRVFDDDDESPSVFGRTRAAGARAVTEARRRSFNLIVTCAVSLAALLILLRT